MRVLVIGGGIGGLTLAAALRRAGIDVHVFEQMRELREIGAGLVLGANAGRVLIGLGLEDKLRNAGLIALSNDRLDWETNAFIERTRRAEDIVKYQGLPSYIFHRADAHELVKSAVRDTDVTLSARCVAVEEAGGQVVARFADGSSATGDLLVGADGADSVVRGYVTGSTKPIGPVKHAWRGLAPGEAGRKLGLEMRQYSYRAFGKFFLAYYVSNYKYVNWVGIMNPKEEWTAASRFVPGDRDAALADYEGWAEPVRILISSTDEVSKWIIYDGDPLPFWTHGHVTLLGDAAHPMLPFAGQGAGQSIEDAIVLTRCLQRTPDDLDQALESYFDTRYERASRVQSRGRMSGARILDPQVGKSQSLPEPPIPDDWVLSYNALTAPLAG